MEGKLFERTTAQTSKQTPKKANPAKSPPPSGNTSFDYSVVQAILFLNSCDFFFFVLREFSNVALLLCFF